MIYVRNQELKKSPNDWKKNNKSEFNRRRKRKELNWCIQQIQMNKDGEREKPLANPPIILTSRIFEESENETSKRNDSDSSNNK